MVNLFETFQKTENVSVGKDTTCTKADELESVKDGESVMIAGVHCCTG